MSLESDVHDEITEEKKEDLSDFARKTYEEYMRFNAEKMGVK